MLGFNIARFQTNVTPSWHVMQYYPHPTHQTLCSSSAFDFKAYITRCSNYHIPFCKGRETFPTFRIKTFLFLNWMGTGELEVDFTEREISTCFPHLSVTNNLTKWLNFGIIFLVIHLISVELDLHVLFTAIFPLVNDLHQLKFCHAVPPDFNLSN